MKKILLAGAAIVAFAATAQAADLGARRTAVPAAVAYAPAINWNSVYGGVQVGGVFGNRTLQNGTTDIGFNSGAGVSLGGQIGVNYQVAPAWVVGAVADLAWTSTQQQVGTSTYYLPYEGSLRLKGGYLVSPQLLAYVTGGLAFGADRQTNTANGFDSTQGRIGWTAGVGAEYKFNPAWSAFGEYRYVDLGNATFAGTNYNSTHHKLLVGVNYHFGMGAAGPVVAKY